MALPHPKGEKLLMKKIIDLPTTLFFNYNKSDTPRFLQDRDEALD